MSGTSPTPAEQHLGDRLAALVDGELGHDARERVQAHLATCPKCKAEADAQRKLKNVFAQTAPPPPSEGLLARLQSLPGGPLRPPGSEDDDDRRGLFDGGSPGNGVFRVRTDGFGYLPATAHAGLIPGDPDSGFRIHEVGRQETDRSQWRARRFAFVAASAVSLAAMALGGSVPLGAAADAVPRGVGNNVTPMRAPGSTAPAGLTSEAARRQGGGTSGLPRSAGPTAAAPPDILQAQTRSVPSFSTGMLNGASPAPFIQPTGSALQIESISGVSPSAAPGRAGPAAPTLPVVRLSSRR